jgi:hypothetical protein
MPVRHGTERALYGPEVTVNGSDAGRHSPVVFVIRPDLGMEAARKAEALVRELTGREPSTWRDGTGTTTVTASTLASAAAGPRPVAAQQTANAQRFTLYPDKAREWLWRATWQADGGAALAGYEHEPGLPDIGAAWRPGRQEHGATVGDLLRAAQTAGILRCPDGWTLGCEDVSRDGTRGYRWMLARRDQRQPLTLAGEFAGTWPPGEGAEAALDLLSEAPVAGSELLGALERHMAEHPAPRAADTNRIVALYNEGRSLRAVGEIVGRSAPAVLNHLKDAGVERRTHGRTDLVPGDLRRQYDAGKGVAELALLHDAAPGTIRRRLRDAGTSMRPGGRQPKHQSSGTLGGVEVRPVEPRRPAGKVDADREAGS